MKVYELDTERFLHPVEGSELSPDWIRDELVRWVVSTDFKPGTVEEVCRSCGIEVPQQVADVLGNLPPQPVVIRLEKLLFISCPYGAGDEIRRDFVVCAPSTLLTFHTSSELADVVIRDCVSERRIRAHAPIAILVELIDAALEQMSGRVIRLRRDLVSLSDEVESGRRNLEADEYLALKQEATAIEIQFEDYLHCSAEIVKFESEIVTIDLVRPLIMHCRLPSRAALRR